jgi:hypothetical protein
VAAVAGVVVGVAELRRDRRRVQRLTGQVRAPVVADRLTAPLQALGGAALLAVPALCEPAI